MLASTCDRKIAERRLKDWVRTLTSVDYSLEKTTMAQLIAKLVAARAGTSAKTQATDRCIIKQLERTWMGGLQVHFGAPRHAPEKRIPEDRRYEARPALLRVARSRDGSRVGPHEAGQDPVGFRYCSTSRAEKRL